MESDNMRKYAKIFMDYTHVSAYSPPEMLCSELGSRKAGIADTPPRSQNSQVILNLS
jgi:hypothetical protein